MNNTQDDPRDRASAPEALVEAALDSFDRPSRAAVWAKFAAAAVTLGPVAAAEAADALLGEFDKRFS
jgi:hypothetical protein